MSASVFSIDAPRTHRRSQRLQTRLFIGLALALSHAVCADEVGDRIATAAAELAAAHRPYVAYSLGDPSGPEQSGLPTTGLDCMTFIEAALMRAANVTSQTEQQHWLRITRYDDKTPSYCSRAHYLSDWLSRNAMRGWIADITSELAAATGASLRHHPWKRSWMAEHGLDPTGCVTAAGSAEPVAYIAPQDYGRLAHSVLPGDILAFVARAPGLDNAHLAIAEPHGGIAMASSLAGHTLIKPDWQAYARAQTGFLGLRVFRVRTVPQY